MARVTVQELKVLINDNNANDTVLASYIDTASEIVDDRCLTAGYDDKRLHDIELYLAAHLYEIPSFKQQKIGDITITYFDLIDSMRMTKYGNIAMMLDKKHKLIYISAKPITIKKL